jgi:3-hydroxyisobutyrate dehydrogenase-like beta-hydroxyacid dehydrogenase
MAKAGVIGLGVIGSGVALCLARAGLLEAVYDVRKTASEGLDGVPPVAGSAAALARHCDVVLIAVVSAEQTIDVLTGPDGVLAAARPGLNVVLLATVSIEDLTRIRAITEAAGVGLVDCGVTGGQAARRNGLVCLVGAEPERLAAVKPVLDGFAKSVAHMGGPGAGMAAKIARNVIVYGCLRAGYEGAMLARAAGVDVLQLAQVIADSADGVGGPMMLMGRPADPRTDADEAKIREGLRVLMIKDLEAALDLGKSVDVALPLAELTLKTDRATAGLDPV